MKRGVRDRHDARGGEAVALNGAPRRTPRSRRLKPCTASPDPIRQAPSGGQKEGPAGDARSRPINIARGAPRVSADLRLYTFRNALASRDAEVRGSSRPRCPARPFGGKRNWTNGAPISGLPEIGKFGFPDRPRPIWVRRLKKYGERSIGFFIPPLKGEGWREAPGWGDGESDKVSAPTRPLASLAATLPRAGEG